jgi:hypothetical protein
MHSTADRVLALAGLMLLFQGSGIGASRPELPRLEKHNPVEFNQILRENALFFQILVSFSYTAAVADDSWGVNVRDINLNLITREVRTPQGHQIVRARVAGTVRGNHNVELDLLNEAGVLVGKGFFGYESGQLSFYDRNSKEIISGYMDSNGNYILDDLRLPPGRQDLANGFVDSCIFCSYLEYGWYDGLNFQVGGGRMHPFNRRSDDSDIRVYWSFEQGLLNETQSATGEAEYRLSRESTGAINSVLFDTARTAESFFANPYGLVSEPVAQALLPRVTNSTGIAVTNGSPNENVITYVARYYNGAVVYGDGIENPVSYRFAPGRQFAAYPSEIFRTDENDSRPVFGDGEVGWVEIFSDEGDLQAMYLDGNSARTALDGNVAGESGADPILFTSLRLGAGESTEIELLNLSYDDVIVRLELLDASGGVLRSEPEFFLSGYGIRSFFLGQGSDFLRPGDPNAAAALRVSCSNSGLEFSDCGRLLGLATYFGRDSVASSYAASADTAGPILVGTHFVTGRSGEGSWKTAVNVARLDGAGRVLLDVYNAAGNLVATLSRDIPPRGQGTFILDESTFASAAQFQGYMRCRAESGAIAGEVAITYSSRAGSMSSSYPLANYLSKVFQFNQVAEGASGSTSYWTGVAVMNDLARPVDATLQVFRSDGTLDRTATLRLEPFQQGSTLLRQLFNDPSYNRVGGYIRLTATEPVSAIVLYGDLDRSFLSAVPGIPR